MSEPSGLRKSVQNLANARRFLLPLLFCLVTLLTGCVRYDVGLNFDSPYSGTLVQHIKIGEQFSNLGKSEAIAWLKSLESRSRKLQGKVKKLSSEEVVLIVPFTNGQELSSKFNQLFNSNVPDTSAVIVGEEAELVKLGSKVSLQQNNLLFAERNHLDITIDLRAINLLAHQDKISIAPNSLLDLKFDLNTPWIANNIDAPNNLEPLALVTDQGLTWQLKAGELNHIEAVFWLPSPIGIGAVVIILVMVLGFMLKYRRFPGTA
ncbi:Protein of unknown function (DUF3153) [Xenococcus sp. PCC 7305]|uniref:DUF3153 domain-containing protein n=1 Tax=Xenococcus sp. PCC 7305 TaxID=102125 RepID=UPI0002ACCE2E|nr:DUF3153 domain-containing protein [Xenococcus sp. PCC 7305]ELS02771.1 Protein of unknown function (DUF3153) [Xenococcus sp. PCC 7305]